MKKSTIQGYVVLAVILAAFCDIAFAVPFVKNAVFWLAFAFTLVAFGVEVYAFRTSFGKEDVRSKFYGFPIARLAVVYFIVQLVLALVLMALAQWGPVWVAVILFVVVLAAAPCRISRASGVVNTWFTTVLPLPVMRTLPSEILLSSTLPSPSTRMASSELWRKVLPVMRLASPMMYSATVLR